MLLHLTPWPSCRRHQQTGALPDGIVDVLADYNSLVDLRLNYFCCCGINFTYDSTYALTSYMSYNLSAPRLPKGLSFSSQVRPVSYRPGYIGPGYNLGNSTYPGLSCPYLRRSSDPDEPTYYLNWFLDPE